MNLYDALAEYDAADVEGTIADVAEEINKLPQLHSDLWAIFQTVANKQDTEAMERLLEPENRRQHFYEALTDYARALRVALSTTQFYEDTPEKRINLYKNDLKFFHQLRQSVKMRYAEAIDYRDYEEKVRKLMDEHIKATGTSTITELVNIFDAEKFDAEVEKLGTPTAKADTILNRMKRTITERMDEDPAFYRRFSELVEETILAYRQGRIDQLEYLQRAEKALDQMRTGRDSGLPLELSRYQHAPAYYGILRLALSENGLRDNDMTELAIQIEQTIESHKVTDWTTNLDVQKRIKQHLDEMLYELERRHNLALTVEELDMLIEQVLEVAKARDGIQ